MTDPETWYAVLFGASILFGLGFIVAYGPPWRTNSPDMAWLQAGIASASLFVDSLLLAVLLGLMPAPWVILSILGWKVGIFAWRLVKLAVTRKEIHK